MTANTWPNPARPGVPMNPELDGWHWLKTPDNEVIPFEWRVEGECERGRWPSYWVSQGEDCWEAPACKYLGPVLTPDEVAAIKARSVKWAGIVGTLKAERDQLIGALQIAIERSGDLEPRPAWLDGACGLLNRGFLKVDRAALAEAAALQKRVAKLEGALKDAAASVGEWGAYASQYLQDKWDLPGEVARYIAIAEGKNDAALTGGKDE